jgi:acyl carrier protein
MSKNIEQSVKTLMAAVFNVDAASIDDASSMDNTPGWDSANHINLVLALEEEFNIAFDAAELESMASYFDIVQTVSAKL